jgi:putative SOS response-associated peptidase YedK
MGCEKASFARICKSSAALSRRRDFTNGAKKSASSPYYFSRKDGKPLMLAGIWQEAEYKGDKRIAFAILTDEPNGLVASYHDRMPLALAEDKVAAWLDLTNEAPLNEDLLLDLGEFSVRPMDRAMNSVRQKSLPAIDPEVDAA